MYAQTFNAQCTMQQKNKNNAQYIRLHSNIWNKNRYDKVQWMSVCVVCRPCEVISSPGQVDLVSWCEDIHACSKKYGQRDRHTHKTDQEDRKKKSSRRRRYAMHPKAGFVQKSIFNSVANVHWVLLALFCYCCCCCLLKSLHWLLSLIRWVCIPRQM